MKGESVKAIMVLTLFLTIKTTVGQSQPCACSSPSSTVTTSCYSQGCSVGTNPRCDRDFDGNFRRTGVLYYAHAASGSSRAASIFQGCNCPNTPYSGKNGYYYYTTAEGDLVFPANYNYTDCTDFGGNAHDRTGHLIAGANGAVDCCNFCCNRNDPYPDSTVDGRGIILDKSLYLSSLTMLVLIILKIN